MVQNIAHTVGGMKGTMSSLEIAKLTGKRHADVLRDIRDFLAEIDEGDQRRFASIYQDAYGRDQECYILPKRECLGLASKYDAKLRMAIIDRWAELEYKEQQKPQLSPRMQAITEWEDETTAINNVLSKLGYSQGYLRKEALEIGFRIEGETGEKFIPNVLACDPEAVNPQALSEHTGTHAAYVGIGTQGSNASSIAQVYGKDISPTDINNILIERGYHIKWDKKGKYSPTEKGKMLCNQSTLASGNHKGKIVIKEWLYNTNKALRDEISDGVEKLRQSRK